MVVTCSESWRTRLSCRSGLCSQNERFGTGEAATSRRRLCNVRFVPESGHSICAAGLKKCYLLPRFDLWAVLLANNLRGVLANSGDSAHHSEEGTFRKTHLCLCALECAFGVGDRS